MILSTTFPKTANSKTKTAYKTLVSALLTRQKTLTKYRERALTLQTAIPQNIVSGSKKFKNMLVYYVMLGSKP